MTLDELVGKEMGRLWVNAGGSQRPPGPSALAEGKEEGARARWKQPGTSRPHSSGCCAQEGPGRGVGPQAAVLMLLGEGSGPGGLFENLHKHLLSEGEFMLMLLSQTSCWR